VKSSTRTKVLCVTYLDVRSTRADATYPIHKCTCTGPTKPFGIGPPCTEPTDRTQKNFGRIPYSIWYFGIVARDHTAFDTIRSVHIIPRNVPSTPYYHDMEPWPKSLLTRINHVYVHANITRVITKKITYIQQLIHSTFLENINTI
jgi:hypothetical protein